MNTPAAVTPAAVEGSPVDKIPSNLRSAAGPESAKTLDSIWGDDDGDGGSEEVVVQPTPPATPPPATPPATPPAAPATPPAPAAAPTDAAKLSKLTGLPESLVAAQVAPTPATLPAAAAQASPEEAAEEARAQQMASSMQDKSQREAFISLRHQIKEEKQRRKEAELRAQQATQILEQTRTQTGQVASETLSTVTKELEAAKAQLAAMDAEMGKTNYERSREYQEKYALPAQATVMKMAKLAETVGGHPKPEAEQLVASLLRATPQERASILAEESVAIQGALISAASDYDSINENATIALDNWKSRKAAMDEEQRRANQMGLIKNLFADTEKAVTTLAKEGNALLIATGNPEWDKTVSERVSAVRGVLQSGDPEVLIKYVADGVTAPKWREMYWDVVKAYGKLQSEAKGLVAATPGLGADGSPETPATPAPKTSKGVMDQIWGADSR